MFNICVGNHKKEIPLSFYELVDSLLNGTYVYIIICATISQRPISYCVILVSDSPNDKAKQIKFDKLLNPNVLSVDV